MRAGPPQETRQKLSYGAQCTELGVEVGPEVQIGRFGLRNRLASRATGARDVSRETGACHGNGRSFSSARAGVDWAGLGWSEPGKAEWMRDRGRQSVPTGVPRPPSTGHCRQCLPCAYLGNKVSEMRRSDPRSWLYIAAIRRTYGLFPWRVVRDPVERREYTFIFTGRPSVSVRDNGAKSPATDAWLWAWPGYWHSWWLGCWGVRHWSRLIFANVPASDGVRFWIGSGWCVPTCQQRWPHAAAMVSFRKLFDWPGKQISGACVLLACLQCNQLRKCSRLGTFGEESLRQFGIGFRVTNWLFGCFHKGCHRGGF